MTDSSDEQIISRKRLKKQQPIETLETLFDSESEYEQSSEQIEAIAELTEIFGNRTEYLYLLEDIKSDTPEQNSESSINEEIYDETELQQYVSLHREDTGQQKIDAVYKAVTYLNEGYPEEHIVLNVIEGEIGIEEMYDISDLCSRFQTYRKIKKEFKGNSNYKLETLKELIKYKHILERIEKQFHLNRKLLTLSGFFLSEEEWIENLTQKLRINEPIDPETNIGAFLDSLGCTRETLVAYLGERLGRHPLFVGEESLFLNSDCLFNPLRKEILNYANALTKTNENTVSEKEAINRYYHHIIDYIVNGAISTPKEGSFIFGVTEHGYRISMAISDFKGELVLGGLFSIEEIIELYEKYKPYCVGVSGNKVSIRNLFNNLRERFENVIYVENELINFSSNYPLGIARRLIYPEIEIANLLEQDIPLIDSTGLLSKELKLLWMRRGLITALSIVGIDINYAIRVNRAHALLKLIPGIRDLKDFISQVTEYGFISRLEVLETNRILSPLDYVSSSCYLRIYPQIYNLESRYDILDSTAIHPLNYSMIRMICAGYQGYDELDDENPSLYVEQVLSDPERLIALKVPIIEEGISLRVCEYIIGVLKRHPINRPVFKGAPDWLLFRELIGEVDLFVNKEFDGRVIKVGEGYGIVGVSISGVDSIVSVFVRDKVFVNQLVRVYIDEVSLLSFKGRIVEVVKSKSFKFIEHNLFKDFCSKEAEEYLRCNNKRIVIRRSGKGEYGVITLMLEKDIYIHLCLMEVIEGDRVSYEVCGSNYEDINEILSIMVRGIFHNLQEIISHKRYYREELEGEVYLKGWDNGVLYCFYLSKEYPGKLIFAYNAGRGIRKEYIGIKWDGLEYDKKVFKDLDRFIVYRKSRK